MKDQGLTDLVAELETAGANALSKSASVDKRLKAIKPTPVVSGQPLPQEIVFSGSKNGASND